MLLMLLLKAAPENIEVIGYVKSRIVLNTEFITMAHCLALILI